RTNKLVETEVEVEEDEGAGVEITATFGAFGMTYRINLGSLIFCYFATFLRVITLSRSEE
ncbi:18574_t:CDS:1, partial [Funneliformis geosporum]